MKGISMATTNPSALKVARARQKMRAAGLRPVQFWVPDTRAESFAADIRQQCLALKADPAEADVLHLTTEAAAQVQGWV
jgi:hypothetical protein